MDDLTGVVTNKAHFRYCRGAAHTGDTRKIRKGERWWITMPQGKELCDGCYQRLQDAAMPQTESLAAVV